MRGDFFLFVVILFSFSNVTFAEQPSYQTRIVNVINVAVCATYVGSTKREVNNYYKRFDQDFKKAVGDKFKHCAFSCRLANKCGASGAWSIGTLKEVLDYAGFGSAEWADIQANQRGISYAKQKKGCYVSCTGYANSLRR